MNRIRPLALGAILLAVAECTAAGTPPTRVPPTRVPPTAVASPGATVGPASPAPSPSRTAEPSPPAPVPATLDHADGPPVAGEVGSYTIGGFGSDGPWLPASALEQTVTVNVGGRLRIRLDGDRAVGSWSVAAARADDTRAERLFGLDEGDAAPQGGVIVVGVPPAGDWVVMASLSFEGGSGAYYWHVIVTE